MVVVEKLTKYAHFIMLKTTHKATDVVRHLYEGSGTIAWNSQDNCVRQRPKIYLKFLERVIQGIQNEFVLKTNINIA
jgi:hypothetical protein